MLHLGGDEVGLGEPAVNWTAGQKGYECFNLEPSTAAWLRARNMSAASATDYFWTKLSAEVLT